MHKEKKTWCTETGNRKETQRSKMVTGAKKGVTGKESWSQKVATGRKVGQGNSLNIFQ